MFTFGIAVADYVMKWRRLYDSVNYGPSFKRDEFDRAAFFFIKTEVSAQYLQCLCSCFNLIQPEWNIKTLLVLNTDELKDFYSPNWTRHKIFEISPSPGGCTEQLLVIKSINLS